MCVCVCVCVCVGGRGSIWLSWGYSLVVSLCLLGQRCALNWDIVRGSRVFGLFYNKPRLHILFCILTHLNISMLHTPHTHTHKHTPHTHTYTHTTHTHTHIHTHTIHATHTPYMPHTHKHTPHTYVYTRYICTHHTADHENQSILCT